MPALVTFVVPTIPGREELLTRALGSLFAQTCTDWNAIVVGDGHLPDGPQDERIQFVKGPESRSAGLTRNSALPLVDTRWTAFLDDDDYLDPRYVKWLKQYQQEWGCIVFRMKHPTLGVLPDKDLPQIKWGGVGISFAVRTALVAEYGLAFVREQDPDSYENALNEDITFLQELQNHQIRLYIHPEVAYFCGEETVRDGD
jgi:glycosyltransferase involved in cell wall biosynthesis